MAAIRGRTYNLNMDYSPTTIQVFLALAMLLALVGALWPKLVCRTSVADQDFRGRNTGLGHRIEFRGTSRHALRVRQSYDRMFGSWLHVSGSAPHKTSRDKAA